MGAIVRRVAGVMLVCVLVGTVLLLATLFWLVRTQGWLVQTVATGSMEPSVPTGSVIVSRPVDPHDIRTGDVIVFRSPTGATVTGGADGVFQATDAMLITHRVVDVRGDADEPTFRTKGDGNADEDPWDLTGDMVQARYVTHVPRIGALLAEPDMRRWLLLGVAALGCVVIVSETRGLARELRSRRDDVGSPPTQSEAEVARPDGSEAGLGASDGTASGASGP